MHAFEVHKAPCQRLGSSPAYPVHPTRSTTAFVTGVPVQHGRYQLSSTWRFDVARAASGAGGTSGHRDPNGEPTDAPFEAPVGPKGDGRSA